MLSEREKFLSDVICTAVEGGIGYWSQVSDYKWENEYAERIPASVTVYDRVESIEPNNGVLVGTKKVNKAIHKICDLSTDIQYLHPNVRRSIAHASIDNDAGDIDADLADVIIQVAMFGNVRYG